MQYVYVCINQVIMWRVRRRKSANADPENVIGHHQKKVIVDKIRHVRNYQLQKTEESNVR